MTVKTAWHKWDMGDLKRIVTADVGGTHARFAIASMNGNQVTALDNILTFRTADFTCFENAWEEFGHHIGTPLPKAIAIAFAGPTTGGSLKLTNNSWTLQPGQLAATLGVNRHIVVNDFGAIAHAVAACDGNAFGHVCGNSTEISASGIVTVIGPGTGFGVAALIKRPDHYHVIETEAGHIDYAPLDSVEDRILDYLRKNFSRVSVERLVSGNGLYNIYAALAAIEGWPLVHHDDKALWAAALSGNDSFAAAALDRYLLILGAISGDLALALGADAVVIAGVLALRLTDHFPRSGFASRFVAKGRFEQRMESLPVKLMTYPEPGLLGAAVAFAQMLSGQSY